MVTDPAGRLPWTSPALPGRAHDLTAARTRRIIRICARQGVPALAVRACLGGDSRVATPTRRPSGGEPAPTRRTVDRVLARIGHPSKAEWRG